jgi:hypothetical protein
MAPVSRHVCGGVRCPRSYEITSAKTYTCQSQVKVLFYPTLHEFWKLIVFCIVPRLHPFVLLVRVNGRCRWVCRIGGRVLTEDNRNIRRKPVPVHFYPPQIPHGLTWDRSCASAVRGQQLTTSAMAWPLAKVKVYFSFRSSPYRAVNTLRLGYKNQSVNVV